jgi:hypothetical protein
MQNKMDLIAVQTHSAKTCNQLKLSRSVREQHVVELGERAAPKNGLRRRIALQMLGGSV